MVVLALLVIVALVFLWVWSGYNSLVKLQNFVEASWAQIDVQLKRRFDLIPNLVETVKGYASHEKEVLEKVTAARNLVAQAGTAKERMEAENMLSSNLSRLIAVSESYPELKANTNFLDLQKQLGDTENKIEGARRQYNDRIMQYHAGIRQFPRNLLASIFNFSEKEYFSARDEEREAVKVKF